MEIYLTGLSGRKSLCSAIDEIAIEAELTTDWIDLTRR
jgi:hypothetical protein